MPGMSHTRFSRAALVATAAALLCLVALVPPAAGAKPKSFGVLGFSLRGSPGSLVEPGSTLRPRNCKPRRLFAFVEMKGVRRGALLTWTWRLNGGIVTRYERVWDHGRQRRVERLVLSNSLGLPRGTYQLAVKVPGKGTALGKVDLRC